MCTRTLGCVLDQPLPLRRQFAALRDHEPQSLVPVSESGQAERQALSRGRRYQRPQTLLPIFK